MFGKVKKWLGIEGVKLEIIIPEEIDIKPGDIDGTIHLFSMTEQTIRKLTVRLIERYSRGSKSEQLTDEYTLGEISMEKVLEVTPEAGLEIDFNLPYRMRSSEIDDFAKKNILTGGIAKLAKMAYGVKSSYRIEAEAEIDGVALNPIVKKEIVFKA